MERDPDVARRAALVLGARLLCASAKGVRSLDLSKSLRSWLPPEAELDSAVMVLEDQGFIQRAGKSIGLNAEGRRQILSQIGLTELSGATKFEALAKRAFPALALQIAVPEQSGAIKRFTAPAGLAAAIVRAQSPMLMGLPSIPAKDPDVLMPLAIAHLRTKLQVSWGPGPLPKLNGLVYQSVLASLVGQERPIAPRVALENLARRALGVPRELSTKDWPKELTRRWILGHPISRAEAATSRALLSEDPQALIGAMKAATANTARGWFGTDRLFIAAAYDALIDRYGPFPGGRAAFDERLLSLARSGLVKLTRADYVEAMDQDLLMRSRILDRGVERHFLEDWKGSDS